MNVGPGSRIMKELDRSLEGDKFKQTLKFFVFIIFKVLAHEQILTQV